ncbi:MAG: Lipoate synthase [Ignavibacteriae bacterium]|nr:MAG: Lipoate synthase [Ignavibacteriota bacterium]
MYKEENNIKRPDWLKVRIPQGQNFSDVKSIIEKQRLHTVCSEARCPNMGECWNSGTATFMILGDICTRSCGFCAVKTGMPTEIDAQEPLRVANAVRMMKLKYAVVTSVNRDELFDGGASIFAETVRQIRKLNPECKVEVLIPDFKGDEFALNILLDSFPDVLNHNIETVPRLYPIVRPQAKYERSLQLLTRAKKRGFITKSGLMVGLGENDDEVFEVLNDLKNSGCDIVTIGQYLQPTREHLPVKRFVHPDQFKKYKEFGDSLGFLQIESGPLVRSSYHAEKIILKNEKC